MLIAISQRSAFAFAERAAVRSASHSRRARCWRCRVDRVVARPQGTASGVTWPNPQKYGQRVLDDGALFCAPWPTFFGFGSQRGGLELSGSTRYTSSRASASRGRRPKVVPRWSGCKPWQTVCRIDLVDWPTRVVRLHGTTGVPAGTSRVHLVRTQHAGLDRLTSGGRFVRHLG
jgi:hypothetical protein